MSLDTRDLVWLVYKTFLPEVTLTEQEITDHATYLETHTTEENVQWLGQKPEEGGHYLTNYHTMEYYDRARGGSDPINFANYCQTVGKTPQDVFNEDMPGYVAKEAEAAHLATVVAEQDTTIDELNQEIAENEVIIQELHEALEKCHESGYDGDCGDQTPATPPTPDEPPTGASVPDSAPQGLLERLINALTSWLNRNESS